MGLVRNVYTHTHNLSPASISVAAVSLAALLPQISASAGDPALADKNAFPLFLRYTFQKLYS